MLVLILQALHTIVQGCICNGEGPTSFSLLGDGCREVCGNMTCNMLCGSLCWPWSRRGPVERFHIGLCITIGLLLLQVPGQMCPLHEQQHWCSQNLRA